MAVSAPTNPTATVASFLLLLGLVVVASGARQGPASAPVMSPEQEADGVLFTGPMSTVEGSTQAPASAPVVVVLEEVDSVPFTGPMSTEGPASAPAPQEADGVESLAGSTPEGPASAPAPVDGSGSIDGRVSTAEGPTTQAPAAAPVALLVEAADGPAGTVSFDRPMPTDSRRCDSHARWNEGLCRTVCGMYKFHGYEFTEVAADQKGADAGPRCCCCPSGASCVQL